MQGMGMVNCLDSIILWVNMARKYGMLAANTILWADRLCSPTIRVTSHNFPSLLMFSIIGNPELNMSF